VVLLHEHHHMRYRCCHHPSLHRPGQPGKRTSAEQFRNPRRAVPGTLPRVLAVVAVAALSGVQGGEQGLPVRGAEAGARVPPGPRGVGAVAAGGDVPKACGGKPGAGVGVEGGVQQSQSATQSLAEAAHQRRPQRGHGTGPADDQSSPGGR